MSNNTTADVTGIFNLDTNRLVGLAAKGSSDVTYFAGQDTPTSGVPLTASTSGGVLINGRAWRYRPSDKIVDAANSGASSDICLIGDSTGNGGPGVVSPDEWFYTWVRDTLMPRLSAGTRLEYQLFDDSTQKYTSPVVMQTGAGAQSIVVSGAKGALWRSEMIPVLSDLFVETPDFVLANWTAPAEQSIIAQFGPSGSRIWQLFMSSGHVNFRWSADGTALVSAVTSVLPTWVAGQPYRLRVTLDVNNGAGGYVLTISRSADSGITWAVLYTTTGGSTTSVYALAGQPLEIGIRQATNGTLVPGNAGIAVGTYFGAPYISPNLDGSGGVTPSMAGLIYDIDAGVSVANPACVRVYNASISGRNLPYLTDPSRVRQVSPVGDGALVCFSSCHNETSIQGFRAVLEAAKAAIDAKVTDAKWAVCTQNPTASPNPALEGLAHANRVRVLRNWAASKNMTIVESYADFVPSSDLVADGKHPNDLGTARWAGIAAISL